MRIESLQRRRGQQFCMVLDDGRELLLDKQTVEESIWQEGSEIDEEELAALELASQIRRAREYALYLLSLRDYSEVELRRKLREKGYTAQSVDTAARMAELGLVNDEVYARRLARDCRLRKLYARRRTVQELCARGIARETAEIAVDEVDETENLTDLQQALALLEKKRYNVPNTDKTRQRGIALLQRYGYDSSVVRQAFRSLAENDELGD